MEQDRTNFATLKTDFVEKINLAYDIIDETAPIISNLPASPNHIMQHEIASAYLSGVVAMLNESGYMTHYAAAARRIEVDKGNVLFGYLPPSHKLVSHFAEDILGLGFIVRSQRVGMYTNPIGPSENILRVLELFDAIGREYARAHSLKDRENEFANTLRLKRAENYFSGARDTLKVLLLDHASGTVLNESIKNILERYISRRQIEILLGEMRSYDCL